MGIISAVIISAAIIVTNIALVKLARRVDRQGRTITALDTLDTRRSWAIAVLKDRVGRLEKGDNNDSSVS